MVAAKIATLKQGHQPQSRTSAGLTQEQAAAQLNVSERSIQHATGPLANIESIARGHACAWLSWKSNRTVGLELSF
jgi:hypothetical protein